MIFVLQSIWLGGLAPAFDGVEICVYWPSRQWSWRWLIWSGHKSVIANKPPSRLSPSTCAATSHRWRRRSLRGLPRCPCVGRRILRHRASGRLVRKTGRRSIAELLVADRVGWRGHTDRTGRRDRDGDGNETKRDFHSRNRSVTAEC